MKKGIYIIAAILILGSCETEREKYKEWSNIIERIGDMSKQTRKTNPLNIRKSGVKYQGEIQSNEAFKEFSSLKYGIRAAFVCLYTYEKKYGLKTVQDKIHRFAPPHENETDFYANFVAKRIGIKPTDVVSMTDEENAIKMICAMHKIEDGNEANEETVREAYQLFKQDFLK